MNLKKDFNIDYLVNIPYVPLGNNLKYIDDLHLVDLFFRLNGYSFIELDKENIQNTGTFLLFEFLQKYCWCYDNGGTADERIQFIKDNGTKCGDVVLFNLTEKCGAPKYVLGVIVDDNNTLLSICPSDLITASYSSTQNILEVLESNKDYITDFYIFRLKELQATNNPIVLTDGDMEQIERNHNIVYDKAGAFVDLVNEIASKANEENRGVSSEERKRFELFVGEYWKELGYTQADISRINSLLRQLPQYSLFAGLQIGVLNGF